MIYRPQKLYGTCIPGTREWFKLRLIDHFLLQPLGVAWDVIVTSGWRDGDQQRGAAFADGTPVPAALKAKNISQHELGEAVDFQPEDPKLSEEVWRWCLDHLRPWQALLEFHRPGAPPVIHLSIPSEMERIVSKQLIYRGGVWSWWRGDWPRIEA